MVTANPLTKSAPMSSPLILKIWRWALFASFASLSLRFLITGISQDSISGGAAILLCISGLVLGYANVRRALQVFLFAAPLLGGLKLSGLLSCTEPPLVLFSTIFLGFLARGLRNPETLKIGEAPTNSSVRSLAVFGADVLASGVIGSLLVQTASNLWDPQFRDFLDHEPTSG